jgi:outer membrane immunogenic protein
MCRLLIIATTVLLLANPAFAQSPAYNWSGFYLGLTAGATLSQVHETTTLPCTEMLGAICDSLGPTPGNAPLVASAMTGSFTSPQFTGGGEAGYNWQNGVAVYGVEADIETYKGASKHVTAIANGSFTPPNGSPISLNSSVNSDNTWLATIRGRFGIASDRLLVYATGGVAATKLDASFSYADLNAVPNTGNWARTENKFGWAAGGGMQWALGDAWLVKAEYLYVKFGSVVASGTLGSAGGANAISTTADLTVQVARAGVDYKF